MSGTVQTRKDAPSGSIVFNRPNKSNALTRDMVAQVQQAFDDFHQERAVKAVILTGNGDVFSAGTDLNEVHSTASMPDCLSAWHHDSQQLKSLIETILRFPKPVIAAVNGPVMGFGLAMMLACDIVVGSESATIQFPESRLGLSHGLTAPLLSFRAGAGVTAGVMLSGQTVTSTTAHQLRLFHETTTADFVWARSQEIAAMCALGARESHQMTKQMLNDTIGETLMTQLSIGAANLAAARTTDAAKEGVAAFLENRDPDWDSLIRQ